MGQDAAISKFFVRADAEYIAGLLKKREGETRIGERLRVIADWNELEACPARFVLLGIPEDIGVRANLGVGGTHTLWEPALRSFLNMQSTEACSGEDLLLVGAFRFNDWMEASEGMDTEQLRELVRQIDEAVFPLIERLVRAGKIPIVIGGGHNNAYPMIRGASAALGDSINCINLDAHSDYRRIEGRHSGNPFRYARRDGYLDRYAMIGLHRAYNGGEVVNELLRDEALSCSFYEDIFLKEASGFEEEIRAGLQHCSGKPTGIELDLDSIEGVLSSAATPCGITALDARRYLQQCLRSADVTYIHLPEAAVRLRDGREDGGTAKLVAYMIYDLIASGTSLQSV